MELVKSPPFIFVDQDSLDFSPPLATSDWGGELDGGGRFVDGRRGGGKPDDGGGGGFDDGGGGGGGRLSPGEFGGVSSTSSSTNALKRFILATSFSTLVKKFPSD